MNKNILALSVAAIMASGAASASVTLHDADGTTLKLGGRVEARLAHSDGETVDKTRARVYLKGESKVNEDVSLIGYWRQEFKPNGSQKNKEQYTGVKFGSQEVTYGRQYGAHWLVGSFTDLGPNFGNDAIEPWSFAETGDKWNNLNYKAKFGGLRVKANYGVKTDGIDGYGASARYDFDFGFGLGVNYSAHENEVSETETQDSDLLTVGAGYKFGSVKLGANYATGETFTGEDIEALEFAANYKIDKFDFTAIYQTRDVDNKTEVDRYVGIARYKINSNWKTYVAYTVKADKDNVLFWSGRYSF